LSSVPSLSSGKTRRPLSDGHEPRWRRGARSEAVELPVAAVRGSLRLLRRLTRAFGVSKNGVGIAEGLNDRRKVTELLRTAGRPRLLHGTRVGPSDNGHTLTTVMVPNRWKILGVLLLVPEQRLEIRAADVIQHPLVRRRSRPWRPSYALPAATRSASQSRPSARSFARVG
jgi:hypothetical protein